jgi:hypothetical protein
MSSGMTYRHGHKFSIVWEDPCLPVYRHIHATLGGGPQEERLVSLQYWQPTGTFTSFSICLVLSKCWVVYKYQFAVISEAIA